MRFRTVPEHYRRALRLCIGVGLPCLLGYGVIMPDTQWAYSKAFAQSCKWAAITVVVVTMPVIGKVGQVGAERTIGTVVGGTLGFLVYHIGSTYWSDESDGVVLSVAAALVAFSGVIIGNLLGLDLSARLFTITFLLVTFGAQEGRSPLKLAITRIGGIVAGVVLSLLLSILVLPKSASMECVRNLEKALQSLSKLNALAWRKYLPGQDGDGPEDGATKARARRPGSEGYEALPGEDPGSSPAPAVAASSAADASNRTKDGSDSKAKFEDYQEQCEKVLTDIYQSLFKLQENADLAKAEILVGSCGTHLVFVPGLPFVGRESTHMPWAAMGEVATCIRRVARLLLTVISTMEQGFDRDMQAVLGRQYPDKLMQELAEASQEAIQGMCREFPHGDTCPPGCLMRLTAAVDTLVRVSDEQRRAIVKALRGGKRRRFARTAWQQLIDTVREQQQPATAPQPQPSSQSLSTPSSPAAHLGLPSAGDDAFASAEAGQVTREAEEGAAAPQPQISPWRRILTTTPFGGSGAGSTSGAAGGSPGARPLWSPASSKEGAKAAAAAGVASADAGALDSAPTDADRLAAVAARFRQDLVGEGPGSTASSRVASEAEGLVDLAAGVRRSSSSQATPPVGLAILATPTAGGAGAQQAQQARRPADAAAPLSPEGESPALSRRPPAGMRDSTDWGPALRPISSEEIERLVDEQMEAGLGDGAAAPAGSSAAQGQGRRLAFPGDVGRSETLRLAMFPETAEGYVAQVRWYSFQYLLEEGLDELVELHQALCTTLAELP